MGCMCHRISLVVTRAYLELQIGKLERDKHSDWAKTQVHSYGECTVAAPENWDLQSHFIILRTKGEIEPLLNLTKLSTLNLL